MAEGVYSFHRMRDACLADQAEGWYRFLQAYLPLGRHLLERHFPALDQTALLTEVFRAARAHQVELWRTFQGTGEKEFLFHFRQFLMQRARAARARLPETPLTPEIFWSVLEEFPLLQREMLVLSFRRYTPEELTEMMKFNPETTRAAVAQAQEKLRTRLGAAVGPDLLTRDHDALFAALEEQRGEKCLPAKIHARIADGQITWRDREAAERHIESCAYCLNRFAEYHEVFHYYRTLPPAEEAAVAPLAAALGLPAQESTRKKGKAWWLRLLGG